MKSSCLANGGALADLLLMFFGSSFAAGDAQRGAKAFQQCAACHSTNAGEHLTGPSLAHTWGQKAATAKGFLRYSDALKQSGIAWNEKTLDQWLANPARFIPGNTMTFPGIQNADTRQDVTTGLRPANRSSPARE